MNIVEEYLDQEGVEHRPPDGSLVTEENIINTTAVRLANIEIPEMPVDYRVPRAVVEAVLKTAVDVIIWLNEGGEPAKASKK